MHLQNFLILLSIVLLPFQVNASFSENKSNQRVNTSYILRESYLPSFKLSKERHDLYYQLADKEIDELNKSNKLSINLIKYNSNEFIKNKSKIKEVENNCVDYAMVLYKNRIPIMTTTENNNNFVEINSIDQEYLIKIDNLFKQYKTFNLYNCLQSANYFKAFNYMAIKNFSSSKKGLPDDLSSLLNKEAINTEYKLKTLFNMDAKDTDFK